MDCHSLLQGIFPTQGLNPGLPHCRQILYHLSRHGSLKSSWNQGQELPPKFSSVCSVTSALMFTCLIDLEFTFVRGGKVRSNFCLWISGFPTPFIEKRHPMNTHWNLRPWEKIWYKKTTGLMGKWKSLNCVWLLVTPMDWSPPGSSVLGILQARTLEWVPFPSPGDLPNPEIKPRSPALQASFFTDWTSKEALN